MNSDVNRPAGDKEVKILTVDDDRTVGVVLKATLLPYACRLLEAADGVDGLEVSKRERPDLILLDSMMPNMSGLQLLTKLRADLELRSIPVIMLTGASDRENVLRCARLGVHGYLVKPFTAKGVLKGINDVVELKTRKEIARTRRVEDPLQVLLVDDKSAILGRVKVGLADTPWVLQGASDPNQAADVCKQNKQDIILISLPLAGDSAGALLERLRADPDTKNIPVLALSVQTAIGEQSRAQIPGVSGIVAKPIDPADLQLKIKRALDLDTSHRYFQCRENVLVLSLPEPFSEAVAGDISSRLRHKLREAVDGGLNRFIIDMSRLAKADLTLLKLLIEISYLIKDLGMRYCLMCSEEVGHQCRGFQETEDWDFTTSMEEAMAILSRPRPGCAGSSMT
jgi:two-component system cell cycle response regulator